MVEEEMLKKINVFCFREFQLFLVGCEMKKIIY
jgi:hypothetical protein